MPRPAWELLLVFILALGLRIAFFCGPILGDDLQELHASIAATGGALDFKDQFHARFGVWLFNWLIQKPFGTSELTFFLPTWLLSATLPVFTGVLLLRWGYSRAHALWGGMIVATAPFEVLLGTVRSNDLFLTWLLGTALLVLTSGKTAARAKGFGLALLLWLAFYVKLWAAYAFPALLAYWIAQRRDPRVRTLMISFFVSSLLLHATTAIFWRIRTPHFFPWLHVLPGHGLIRKEALLELFLTYPKLIFIGSSEHGTTLFGIVPHLLAILLAWKAWKSSWDRIDRWLFAYYLSFFLFMNFVPNPIRFEGYYSPARIFRYLSPLSFPMTLHLSKLILDFARAGLFSRGRLALLVSVLTLANSATTYWAHRPGLSHRQTLRSVLAPIHAHCPEALIMEGWLQGQVSMLHLKHQCPRTKMLWVGAIYDPSDYLAKIRELEAQAPAGTLLVSGFNSYVHYRPVGQGIRLDPFPGALSSNWKLLHELPPPVFETEGEKVRIWRLDKPKP